MIIEISRMIPVLNLLDSSFSPFSTNGFQKGLSNPALNHTTSRDSLLNQLSTPLLLVYRASPGALGVERANHLVIRR